MCFIFLVTVGRADLGRITPDSSSLRDTSRVELGARVLKAASQKRLKSETVKNGS